MCRTSIEVFCREVSLEACCIFRWYGRRRSPRTTLAVSLELDQAGRKRAACTSSVYDSEVVTEYFPQAPELKRYVSGKHQTRYKEFSWNIGS
jgi:hypothetical protein